MGRGTQYIYLVKVLYCKLLTIGKKLPSLVSLPQRVWRKILKFKMGHFEQEISSPPPPPPPPAQQLKAVDKISLHNP